MRNTGKTSSSEVSLQGVEPAPDLMDVIAEIERRVGQMQTAGVADEAELERERTEQLEELASRQHALAENEREQAKLRDSIVRQQAEIDRLAAELRDREESLSSRESSLGGQAHEMEAARESLARARDELAQQQKEAKHLAEAQRREQRRLAEYKNFLAQREKEVEEQAEQYRKMKRELTEVAEKLAQAERENAQGAEKTAEEKAAAERRIKELEHRCNSLEESCRVLKSKRSASPATESAPGAPKRVRMAPAAGPATATPGLIVLMATVAVLSASAVLWLTFGNVGGALWVAGASYLVPLLGCAAIKRRGVDFGLTLVAMFSGLLGAWFTPWLGVMNDALNLWHLPLEIVPLELQPQLGIAGAALTALLSLSIATGLATDSFEILFRGIFVSIATGAILLLPMSGMETAVAAVAVWVLLHTMMLVKWATPDAPGIFAQRVTATGRPAF